MRMKTFLIFLSVFLPAIVFTASETFAQRLPNTATLVTILKSEDARKYDRTLESLLKSPNEQIRVRAALAAGRIGDDAAVPALTALL